MSYENMILFKPMHLNCTVHYLLFLWNLMAKLSFYFSWETISCTCSHEGHDICYEKMHSITPTIKKYKTFRSWIITKFSYFEKKQIVIYSMQGWPATPRHGVTRKEEEKEENHIGKLFREKQKIKVVYWLWT